ncbi:MAG: hypothetical protein K9I48_02055 [Sphingobacteriales bacterium]|nr:hypothetical protein [Sphingobacteriales bacterium]
MKTFRKSLLSFLFSFDEWELVESKPFPSDFDFYFSPQHKIYIHLVECDKRLSKISPIFFQESSLFAFKQNIKLLHIREEQWLEKPEFIKSRLESIFETNTKIHARQCKIRRIEKPEYDEFMNKHHMLQTAKTKFKFGLFKGDDLLAVMGISGGRWMTQETDLRKSFEIIRFASVSNITVVGGFSKLLKHIENELNVEEWMSYFDLDFVSSNVYKRLGFEIKSVTKVQQKPIPNSELLTYTSGNLKLIKRIHAKK